MSGRYLQLGRNDAPTLADIDTNFMGVNMRVDPVSLPAGTASQAINIQFRQGVAEPRYGFQTQVWAQQLGVDFTIDFPFSFTEEVGFGKVYGATSFADPNGEERQILACANNAWAISPNSTPTVMIYPPGVTLDAPVSFTQAFQVLIMWRGAAANPLQLDTATDFGVEPKWEVIPDETNADYTSTIPDAERGLHYGNRVWVGFENSQVAYSDLLSYTRYDADLSTIWVNEGDSDRLLALAAYGNNSIVAFKNRSIYSLSAVLPDPETSARVQVLTTQRGLVAPETVAQVGRDLWFLSDDGVYAIGQVLENALQAGGEPVSAPMEPIIKRVNWNAAARAQGIYHDGKYFLALPIDGKNYNSIILVFDLVNGQWSGSWEGDFIDVAFFLRVDVEGHRQLAFVSGDSLSGNAGNLYLMDRGYFDFRNGEETTIPTELVTRGYACSNPRDKVFLCGALELLSWHGAAEIDVVRDGVREEANMITFSKDRLVYNLFAKRAYDPTNAGDNFLDPFRQDYSVELLPLAPPPSDPLAPIPDSGIFLYSGEVFGLHQASSERFRIRQDSRFVQFRVRGTRGRIKLRAASIEGHADQLPLRSTI